MEYILIILLFLVILSMLFFKKNIQIKSSAKKKDEIIKAYENQMQEIIDISKGDKELQLKKKIEFLKKVNHDLSMNIFFDEDEAKNIIKKLSNME